MFLLRDTGVLKLRYLCVARQSAKADFEPQTYNASANHLAKWPEHMINWSILTATFEL